jgi:hypothetical protein
MVRFLKKNICYVVLLIIFFFIYTPIFTISTFGPGDDLNYVERFSSKNFYESLKIFFFEKNGVFFQRPISGLFIALSHFFFGENFKLYLITFFIFFLLSNFILYRTIKSLVNKDIASTLLILSITPFLTSSLLQSPYLFSELVLPIFFWSISFYILVNSLRKKNNFIYVSYFFLLISLFCTVISFPLFLINLFVPIIFWKDNFKFRIYLFKVILPFIFIFCFYFFYLLLVKFIFQSHLYGIATFNIYSIYQGSFYYFVILFEFPIMLFESLRFIDLYDLTVISILVILYFYFSRKDKKIHKYFDNKYEKKLFIILFFALLANSLIFYISSYPAATYGYYNRMLISTFVSLILVLSFLLNFRNFFLLKVFVITLILGSSKVIVTQLKEIELLKNFEINILIKAFNDYPHKNKNILLLAKLPLYLENNFNNLEIFWLKWNLNVILRNNNLFVYESIPLSNEILNIDNYQPGHNIFVLSKYLDKDNIDLYLYFDKEKFYEFYELNDLLIYLNKEKIKNSLINTNFREKIKLKFKNILINN